MDVLFKEEERDGNLGISERKGDGFLGFRERKGMETWVVVRGRALDLLV
jgi:hypothetical protein